MGAGRTRGGGGDEGWVLALKGTAPIFDMGWECRFFFLGGVFACLFVCLFSG